jgi:hypothetical protein
VADLDDEQEAALARLVEIDAARIARSRSTGRAREAALAALLSALPRASEVD